MSFDPYAEAERLERETPGLGWVYWTGALSAALRAHDPDDALLVEFDRWSEARRTHHDAPVGSNIPDLPGLATP